MYNTTFLVHCHAAAWDKYIVPNSEGTIPPQSSVDLVITHKYIIPSNCNISDKFKIVIQDAVTDQVLCISYASIVTLLLFLDYREKDSGINTFGRRKG